MTGALENIDNRPTLRFECRYDHGAERVWRAITDSDQLLGRQVVAEHESQR